MDSFRYYHVFAEGEMEELLLSVGGCRIESVEKEQGNYVAVITKLINGVWYMGSFCHRLSCNLLLLPLFPEFCCYSVYPIMLFLLINNMSMLSGIKVAKKCCITRIGTRIGRYPFGVVQHLAKAGIIYSRSIPRLSKVEHNSSYL